MATNVALIRRKSELLHLFASIAVAFDVKGSTYEELTIREILNSYCSLRTLETERPPTCIKWTTEELKKLRPFVLNFRINYPSTLFNCDGGSDTARYLICKSVLVFLAEDFPFMAESILYSHLMEHLDQTIDSWKRTDNLFTDYECFADTREYAESRNLKSHTWWLKAIDIESINGIPIEQLRVQYEEEQQKKEKQRKLQNE